MTTVSAAKHGLSLPASAWHRVRRVQLIRREIRESLPSTAVALLLQGAEFVFEGAPELGASAERGRVHASVMVTIDLLRARAAYRESPDHYTALRVATLMRDHPVLREQLLARVRPYLSRLLADQETFSVWLDFDVRAEGCRIFVDADATGVVGEKVGSSCR